MAPNGSWNRALNACATTRQLTLSLQQGMHHLMYHVAEAEKGDMP